MSAPELLAALAPVLDALQQLRVRHYVGGSIASSAHGLARSSVGADVVAELRPEHVAGLVAALEGDYYVPEARIRDAVARRTSFNLIHLETMLKVDGSSRAIGLSTDAPWIAHASLPPAPPRIDHSLWLRRKTRYWPSSSGTGAAERSPNASGATCSGSFASVEPRWSWAI